MAGSVNKVILVGNLGADPDIRTSENGNKIASFSIATSERWKDKNTGEKRERTEWHRIVIFTQGLAALAENYLKKGSKVYIEGQLQTRKWQDNNGQDRYITEIVLNGFNTNLTMLDSKGAGGPPPAGENDYGEGRPAPGQQGGNNFSDMDDDIPF